MSFIIYRQQDISRHSTSQVSTGAPNEQFVERCIIIPQLMEIYVIKAFSGVFQYCCEKIICSFFPARHTRKFPSQEDKICLVSQPAAK